MSFFNHAKSQYDQNKDEMLIKILHFFLNWSMSMIMDSFYNQNYSYVSLI